jgi:hypothetical protein
MNTVHKNLKATQPTTEETIPAIAQQQQLPKDMPMTSEPIPSTSFAPWSKKLPATTPSVKRKVTEAKLLDRRPKKFYRVQDTKDGETFDAWSPYKKYSH